MQVLRGPILNPQSKTECRFYQDGGLAIDSEGHIVFIGNFEECLRRARKAVANLMDLKIIEVEKRQIISPAFVDAHVHMPQHHVRGQFKDNLMKWLRECIWPEERKFQDPAFAEEKAAAFCHDLAAQGTLLSLVMSSIHAEALQAIYQHKVGHVIAGNVLMDKDCAESGLQQNTSDALALARLLGFRAGTKDYAFTPRFAVTCSMELLRAIGELIRGTRFRVHTHCAESHDEIALVMKDAERLGYGSYTELYAQAELLRRGLTILAHCIYMSDKELEIMRRTGAAVAHCSESNENLGNDRMPIERLEEYGIPYGLGSDVGAGSTLSMPYHAQHYLETHRRAKVDVTLQDALYRATLAGAEILGMADRTGNLNARKEGNLVVLNLGANSTSANEAIEAIVSGSKPEMETRVARTMFKGNMVFERQAA